MKPRITVIGAGPGGYAAALEAARLGGEVTVIERAAAGGTCLNRGCIPAKVWKTAAERFQTIHDAGDFGIEVPAGFCLNRERLLARKNAVVGTLAQGIHARLAQHGVRYLEGGASVADPRLVHVRGLDGTSVEVSNNRLIIATGSAPQPLTVLPFDHERVLSTDDAVDLAEIPESMLIVGGGGSGCEFASIFSALGVKVTLVEMFSRLLPGHAIDHDSAVLIGREMKKRGIAVLTGHTVERADRSGETMRVFLSEAGKPGSKRDVAVAAVLVTVGRIPVNEGLHGLGAARDRDGWLVVNDRMETDIPGVYAIGDILGPARIMLAHTASAEGVVAARNAMGDNREMSYSAIPVGVSTTPETASAGLTEESARERHAEIRTATVHFRSIGKAHTMGEIAGQVKLVAGPDGALLGIHITGPNATELIAEGVLALKEHVSAHELADTVHAHPTLAEAIREAAAELSGKTRQG